MPGPVFGLWRAEKDHVVLVQGRVLRQVYEAPLDGVPSISLVAEDSVMNAARLALRIAATQHGREYHGHC